MVGVITIKDLDGIMEEYGLQIAIKALSWKGTYLNFLIENGLF